MSVLDSQKTYNNLKKKGFIDSPKKSKDHKYLELFHNGKCVLHAKISHGNKDLDDYLIKQMSVQCHLNKNDFMDLASCPLSKEDYFKILKDNGLFE